MHVTSENHGKEVEIQVRTVMQDFWAGFSERLADRRGIELKYGGTPPGSEELRGVLDWSSAVISLLEANEDFPPTRGLSVRSIIRLALLRRQLP